MSTVTIPKKLTGGEELIILPRREYERLSRLGSKRETGKRETVTAEDILRWSRDAKILKKAGKLELFEDLIKREYPTVARKYRLK